MFSVIILRKLYYNAYQNIFTNMKCFILSATLDGGVVECGDRWFSKIAPGIRVNAVQICIDNGYTGTITQYGGNYGVQCKHSSSGGGGSLTDFGITVSWRCEFREGK